VNKGFFSKRTVEAGEGNPVFFQIPTDRRHPFIQELFLEPGIDLHLRKIDVLGLLIVEGKGFINQHLGELGLTTCGGFRGSGGDTNGDGGKDLQGQKKDSPDQAE